MKNIFKMFLICLITSMILALVGCSENNDKSTQSITFSGDYAKLGFKVGVYGSESGALSLSATQAKITCPDGYVIPSTIKLSSFGPKLPQATCDRKGGCQAVMIILMNPKTFTVEKVSVPADKLTYMQANNKEALGTMCVKEDQVKDWI